jgi:hypothetical protein
MSISTADELIEAIAELRRLFPDWRMGQLIANLTMAAGASDEVAVWDVKDEDLLRAARRLIDRNRGRRANVSEPDAVPDSGGVNGTSEPTSQPPPRQVS